MGSRISSLSSQLVEQRTKITRIYRLGDLEDEEYRMSILEAIAI